MINAEIAARVAIQNIEGEYARSWDTADAEAWTKVFVEDGIFEMVAVGDRPGIAVRGRKNLYKFCSEFTQEFQGLHLMHQPVIKIDGNTAESWMHFEFRSMSASGHSSVMGIYLTSFKQTGQGWKIAHRREQAVSRSKSNFYSIPDREDLLNNCCGN
tara:strand:- start:381 stop:851 length:471 start_codon:yes stop_codon:yes gene_type:complete